MTNPDPRHDTKVLSTTKTKELSTTKILLSVSIYLLVSFALIGWFVGHRYFVGNPYEQVGVVAQATFGVAAILFVSLLLYRIARNSDHTFGMQRNLAEQQRRDDQIEFLEKHLNNAIKPILNFSIAFVTVVRTLQGIAVVAGRRLTGDDGPRDPESIPSDEQRQIWDDFKNDYEKYLEMALIDLQRAANEMIASMPVRSLYSSRESAAQRGVPAEAESAASRLQSICKSNNSGYGKWKDYARRCALLATTYKGALIDVERSSFEEQTEFFHATLHEGFISNLLKYATGQVSEIDDLIDSLPDIEMLYHYISRLIEEESSSAEENSSGKVDCDNDPNKRAACNSLPSFRAALAACGIKANWEVKDLHKNSDSSKSALWGLDVLLLPFEAKKEYDQLEYLGYLERFKSTIPENQVEEIWTDLVRIKENSNNGYPGDIILLGKAVNVIKAGLRLTTAQLQSEYVKKRREQVLAELKRLEEEGAVEKYFSHAQFYEGSKRCDLDTNLKNFRMVIEKAQQGNQTALDCLEIFLEKIRKVKTDHATHDPSDEVA